MNRQTLAGVTIVIAVFARTFSGTSQVTAQQSVGWVPAITQLTSPALAKSGEPQLTVSDRGLLLSWIEHDGLPVVASAKAGSTTTLKFAERTSTGWTEPRVVASGSDWSINAMDVPSVLRLSSGTLVASWMQRSGTGMHSNAVRLSYSKDDGRTWARSFAPHQDTQAERLFASLFQMSGGGLGLIWLEGPAMSPSTSGAGRNTPQHAPGADHMHQSGSGQKGHEGHGGRAAMSASGDMTVRFASFDTAWKRTTEVPIDLRVCECCPTTAAVTSEGIIAAYRDRSDDEVRDIYVSRFEQGRWSDPVAVHADNWRIPACPVNGPALSASGRHVAVAWYTVKQDQGQAYAAFSRDAGRTFGTPIRLDDGGSLGRVDVQVLPDGSLLASWLEVVDNGAQFRVRHIAAHGARSTPVTVTGLAATRTSGYPRVARHGDEFVFAWTETTGSVAQVRTAVARLPASQPR